MDKIQTIKFLEKTYGKFLITWFDSLEDLNLFI